MWTTREQLERERDKHPGHTETWAVLHLASAEIERLQAIVDKLDETADHVKVVPGMELFSSSSPWIVSTALMLRGGSTPSRGDPWLPLSTRHYYSTREAAEAAGGDDEC